MKKEKKKKFSLTLPSVCFLDFIFCDIFLIAMRIYFVSFPGKVNTRKVKDFVLGEVGRSHAMRMTTTRATSGPLLLHMDESWAQGVLFLGSGLILGVVGSS